MQKIYANGDGDKRKEYVFFFAKTLEHCHDDFFTHLYAKEWVTKVLDFPVVNAIYDKGSEVRWWT